MPSARQFMMNCCVSFNFFFMLNAYFGFKFLVKFYHPRLVSGVHRRFSILVLVKCLIW